MRILFMLAPLAVGCAGNGDGGDTDDLQDPADYACFHVAEGTLVDALEVRDDTTNEVTIGREPYQVILRPNPAVGFVRLETSAPRDVLLLLDRPDTAVAVWTEDQRTELQGGSPNPFCESDIPEHHSLSLAAGTHYIELGPSYWASVWMLVIDQL